MPPPPLAAVNCPAPPDGGGCACGGERCIVNYGWDGMHPDLHIAKTDLIPDTLEDVWTICKDRKITHLFEKEIIVTLSTPSQPRAEFRYTTDGTESGPQSTKYEKPLTIDETTHLRVGAFEGDKRVCLESEGVFHKLIALPPRPEVYLSDLTPLRVVGPGHTYGNSVRYIGEAGEIGFFAGAIEEARIYDTATSSR